MGQQNIMLTNRYFLDLNPRIAGEEACAPAHRFGPAVRPYTLIHYVISGKGVFCARGQTYSVHPGESFLILPGEVTTYEADKNDPWHYQWIGFDGMLSQSFQLLPPVFPVPGSLFPDMLKLAKDAASPEYPLAALLFLLLQELCGTPISGNGHISKVKSYIGANYMQPLRVDELAKQLNLDRRYLSRLFKQKTGVTVQEYIIRVRLEKGAQYLRQGYSVSDAAMLCGYEDCSNFSRMFKKHYGKSPAFWGSEP